MPAFRTPAFRTPEGAGGEGGEANLRGVNRTVSLLLASLVAAAMVGGLAAPSHARGEADSGAAGDANNFLFVGGGTPLTNGLFFPGTLLCDSGGCTGVGPALTIDKGDDVTLVNLDVGLVSNSHQATSIKTFKKGKKKGQPLFRSEEMSSPGQSIMKMSHVKPGTYEYQCPFHFGMFGQIEVVPQA